MPERWVVNASPIILLCKIGYQHLLPALADEVVVPQAVVDEIGAGPVDDAARKWLTDMPLPFIAAPAISSILSWDLGAGETAVLSYALVQAGWTVVIDDRAARRCARVFGLRVLGTLGIILRARNQGIIPATVPLLHALLAAGMRLDDTIIRKALAETSGESWPV